jgi:hypothetical protein
MTHPFLFVRENMAHGRGPVRHVRQQRRVGMAAIIAKPSMHWRHYPLTHSDLPAGRHFRIS